MGDTATLLFKTLYVGFLGLFIFGSATSAWAREDIAALDKQIAELERLIEINNNEAKNAENMAKTKPGLREHAQSLRDGVVKKQNELTELREKRRWILNPSRQGTGAQWGERTTGSGNSSTSSSTRRRTPGFNGQPWVKNYPGRAKPVLVMTKGGVLGDWNPQKSPFGHYDVYFRAEGGGFIHQKVLSIPIPVRGGLFRTSSGVIIQGEDLVVDDSGRIQVSGKVFGENLAGKAMNSSLIAEVKPISVGDFVKINDKIYGLVAYNLDGYVAYEYKKSGSPGKRVTLPHSVFHNAIPEVDEVDGVKRGAKLKRRLPFGTSAVDVLFADGSGLKHRTWRGGITPLSKAALKKLLYAIPILGVSADVLSFLKGKPAIAGGLGSAYSLKGVDGYFEFLQLPEGERQKILDADPEFTEFIKETEAILKKYLGGGEPEKIQCKLDTTMISFQTVGATARGKTSIYKIEINSDGYPRQVTIEEKAKKGKISRVKVEFQNGEVTRYISELPGEPPRSTVRRKFGGALDKVSFDREVEKLRSIGINKLLQRAALVSAYLSFVQETLQVACPGIRFAMDEESMKLYEQRDSPNLQDTPDTNNQSI